MEVVFMHPVKHFKTITKHRHAVIKHCFKAGIPLQGLLHDLSKYSPVEFLNGAKYYAGDKSPNENERADRDYSSAWLHHKGRNKHHFEYWTDYSAGKKGLHPIKMPPKYLAEMFCDRVAAGKIYNGGQYTDASPLEYFIRGKNVRFIDQKTSDKLEELLRMLAEQGEEKTFAYIREMVKRNKY